MPRPALLPGEHGKVTLLHASMWKGLAGARPRGEWAATARFHDPNQGKVVQLRRFGNSESEAAANLEAAVAERQARPILDPPEFDTLGVALEWWWTHARPLENWTDSTERSMRYARTRVERWVDEPWPIRPGRLEVIAGDLGDGRTAQLALRLLFHLSRMPGDLN